METIEVEEGTFDISEEAKSLAIMAHDLKAPLSSVFSLLSVINKGYVDDPQKIKELVARAAQKTQTLIAVVDDILDYTLLSDKSMMKREMVNLFDILNESINTLKPFADERNIALIIERDLSGNVTTNGNYTFLLRVFNNLIMNAIKYNKKNGQIMIDYSFNREENSVSISVSDTGIGIPEEDKSKIFKIFERGKYARKNINGSLGLGLSLVKQIVEDHYGKIDLSTTEGVGTTITVTLPLIKEGGIPMSYKILVVDDDIDVLDSRKIVLEHNNYQVATATGIKVAQEILEKDKIDLIILDVMMEKDTDGFTFAQQIKSDDRFKKIPIIMATAVNQRTKFKFDLEKDGDFLPVEKFMEKPIDPDDLIKAIRGLLK